MRFVGQAFEVPVRFDVSTLAHLTADDIRIRFNEEHHKVFFFGGASSKPVELVSFRLGMTMVLEDVPVLSESECDDRSRQRDRDLRRPYLVQGTIDQSCQPGCRRACDGTGFAGRSDLHLVSAGWLASGT